MSPQPNHQTSTSSLLHDQLLIPAEKITLDESRDKDTSQSKKKDKEPVVVLLHDDEDGQDHGSSGASKKLNHNAKERLRRMRLHASYLTLGTLLPNHSSSSSSSKKKWSAPSIIDNVITYIPKLQNEIEELRLRKHKLEGLERQGRPLIRAISVLELGESGYEAVVQITMKKEKEDEFSNLLHAMEVQGLSILSASTSLVCLEQKVVSYNFHVKMDEKPSEGDNYIKVLKNNIISSLCDSAKYK